MTVGHGAILHGCTIIDYDLIGMGSQIPDNARIKPFSMVATCSALKENFVVSFEHLVAQVPAKNVRPLSEDEKEKIKISADNYITYFKN